jgi:hypothetical protein
MADYIQSEYEIASQLLSSSTEVVNGSPDDPLAQFTPDQRLITQMSDYLSYCEHRGHAQHTVMDSTSPAHAGFAIWTLSDIPEVFHHGDLPGSIENLQALLENPDLKQETIGLMQIVQKLYIDLNMRDFRFE